MARVCGICELQDARYKCPVCRAPYCSAACYKVHKERPCTSSDAARADAPPTPAPGSMDNKCDEVDDSIDPTRLLTVEQLARLRESDHVRQYLADERIRGMLAQIDASANRMKALEKALLDPEFSSLMYKALDELIVTTNQ